MNQSTESGANWLIYFKTTAYLTKTVIEMQPKISSTGSKNQIEWFELVKLEFQASRNYLADLELKILKSETFEENLAS